MQCGSSANVGAIVAFFGLVLPAAPGSLAVVAIGLRPADEVVDDTDHCVQARDAQHERRRRHGPARLTQLAHAPRQQRCQNRARNAGDDE
jgi:hypothetical protein